ncbi:MAG: hypothetical protein FWF60_04350 [Oscillospiraceae bacterium]|nr:hypothetical protein [Oscillospiraceae bacterium]
MKSGLGLADTIGFVDSVAATVIDGETGEYRPELFGFAFDAMVLMYFTNIALPEDAGEQFNLICHTDLCFEVKRSIDTEQLEGLRAAADLKIEHLLRCAENALATKMAGLLASFEQLRESTRDIFSTVGGAELKAMVDHLSGMDEATLAKTVLAQQEDTDAQ